MEKKYNYALLLLFFVYGVFRLYRALKVNELMS